MYLVNIFYDVNGNFQWLSMTALAALIVGIIGPIISIYNNKKTLEKQEQMNISNFKGNVVVKARIEWIQEVREKSVDFISACYNLAEFVKTHNDQAILQPEIKKEFNRLKNEIEKNGTLLILYFGPDSNKNNDLIVYLIETLLEGITNKKGDFTVDIIPEIMDLVAVLQDFLRIYFKAEWKRVNGEIEDSDVQKYLEQHETYQKIIKFFSDYMEGQNENKKDFYDIHLPKKYNIQ